MLDVFASVGATRFDVTWTTCTGDVEWFRRGMSVAGLARALPTMLDSAPDRQRNVIVRPHGPVAAFIQLNDLAPANLVRLAPAGFLFLETSPGNFQAWVAMAGSNDEDFSRRLRKGTGAHANACGATRVAGSFNFKDKYAPNFPRVAIRQTQAGCLTTPSELERFGLVTAAEPSAPPPFSPVRARPSSHIQKWPSYKSSVEVAYSHRDSDRRRPAS